MNLGERQAVFTSCTVDQARRHLALSSFDTFHDHLAEYIMICQMCFWLHTLQRFLACGYACKLTCCYLKQDPASESDTATGPWRTDPAFNMFCAAR